MGLDDLEHNMHDVIIVNDEYEPYGTTRDDVFIAMSTIKWLDTTGYIYTQNIFSDSASEVLLTEKTLSILKSVPSSLQKQEESLGVRIKNTMKSASKETMKTIGNEVLKNGIKHFIFQ